MYTITSSGRARAVAALFSLGLIPCVVSAESIVTGATSGTYYAFGGNIRDLIAPKLEVKSSSGSFDNVDRLSREPGVTLAIVQSDVYSGLVRLKDDTSLPLQKRQEYADLLRNLRVFMPLYKEEVHFLVRKDDPSPIEFVHQIKDKRIWMDSSKSGTYLTALTIYKALFDSMPQVVKPTMSPRALGPDDSTKTRRTALMRLSLPAAFEKESDYEAIDVVVLVGGQPLALLKDQIPDNLKLLKFDPNHASSSRVRGSYRDALITRENYPKLNLPEAGITTLAVDSYLITAAFQDPARNRFVEKLARDVCEKYSKLQQSGHAKWRQVAWQPGSALPELAAGWQYANGVRSALNSCPQSAAPPPQLPPSSAAYPDCPDALRIAGLCK